MCLKKNSSFILFASFFSNPTLTSTLFFLNIFIPLPLIDLFGSKEAQKIFLMPYLIIVSVQGGVLDEIEHGSNVMYAVEPLKSSRPLFFLYFLRQYLTALTSA